MISLRHRILELFSVPRWRFCTKMLPWFQKESSVAEIPTVGKNLGPKPERHGFQVLDSRCFEQEIWGPFIGNKNGTGMWRGYSHATASESSDSWHYVIVLALWDEHFQQTSCFSPCETASRKLFFLCRGPRSWKGTLRCHQLHALLENGPWKSRWFS